MKYLFFIIVLIMNMPCLGMLRSYHPSKQSCMHHTYYHATNQRLLFHATQLPTRTPWFSLKNGPTSKQNNRTLLETLHLLNPEELPFVWGTIYVSSDKKYKQTKEFKDAQYYAITKYHEYISQKNNNK